MPYLIYILISIFVFSIPTSGFCLGDIVLHKDTTWSGTITIDGVVVVGRGATLTIEPGSVVRFNKVDRNHDGIGDAEIRVLGQILALGSKEKPIFFKSAESIPAADDWSYVLIFTSGQENKLQYCNFSSAFSGLQVHFSTALVSDSVFNGNREGIRFGRAKFKIEHNRFTNNDIGIRFTRMEGPVEIKSNEITSNRVGIFLVPSGQNIVDFFTPGKDGKAWNEGHLEIFSNNIYDNMDYNLKLGAKQMWDLKIIDNWWKPQEGTDNLVKIFDHSSDPNLGQAITTPMAPKYITTAGPR